VERWVIALCVAGTLGLVACSGSDETDDGTVPLGGINGPAVVDPSFDPFATDPSAPPVTGGD
jgi:hypothetical protein